MHSAVQYDPTSLALVRNTRRLARLVTIYIALWLTLPEVCTISSTITSGRFQNFTGARSRTRAWCVSHAQNDTILL